MKVLISDTAQLLIDEYSLEESIKKCVFMIEDSLPELSNTTVRFHGCTLDENINCVANYDDDTDIIEFSIKTFLYKGLEKTRDMLFILLHELGHRRLNLENKNTQLDEIDESYANQFANLALDRFYQKYTE